MVFRLPTDCLPEGHESSVLGGLVLLGPKCLPDLHQRNVCFDLGTHIQLAEFSSISKLRIVSCYPVSDNNPQPTGHSSGTLPTSSRLALQYMVGDISVKSPTSMY